MNTFEQKCAVLAKTPQVRWYDLRFKPVVQLLTNMQDEGVISMRLMDWSHIFKGASENGYSIFNVAFKYDGAFYVLVYSFSGLILDCFWIEKAYCPPQFKNLDLGNMLHASVVLSSDDEQTVASVIIAVSQLYNCHNLDDIIKTFDPVFDSGTNCRLPY